MNVKLFPSNIFLSLPAPVPPLTLELDCYTAEWNRFVVLAYFVVLCAQVHPRVAYFKDQLVLIGHILFLEVPWQRVGLPHAQPSGPVSLGCVYPGTILGERQQTSC